jgi:hypothetical protein
MSRKSPITPKREANHSDSYQSVPKHDGAVRDFKLSITPVGTDTYNLLLYGALFPHAAETDAQLTISHSDLFGAAQECRKTWMNTVIELDEIVNGKQGKKNRTVFQQEWDLSSKSAEWLREIGLTLSHAGRQLWFTIFEESTNKGVREIGESLRQAAAEKSLVGTVISDQFFVPWNLLYTPPLTDDFDWSGFWGFQHVIEHKMRNGYVDPLIDGTGELKASFNFDTNIDTTLNVACIAPQKAYFQALKKEVARFSMRTKKTELIEALKTKPFTDRITYFCCHGKTSGGESEPNLAQAQIALSDASSITPNEIKYILGADRTLESNPFVFFNACEGGQMSSMFYKSLAALLLEKQARAVLGSQIDIPAVFAPEYTRRFFKRFLAEGEEQPRKLGWLVRDLAQEFVLKHKNPLGITYSLYRGIDCVIRRGDPNGEIDSVA